MNRTFRQDLGETIKGILRERLPRLIPNDDSHYTLAAVWVPIFKMKGQYPLPFTKRATKLAYHPDPISFPGGVSNETDQDPEAAALRKADDKIGLLKDAVEILAPIDDSLTFVPPFIVHSFVGRIPYPYRFNINPEEVEKKTHEI